MYIAVLKLIFDVQSYQSGGTWEKDAGAVCAKLRAHFRVLARTYAHSSGELALVVASLEGDEVSIDSQFEKIIALCETCGLGRLETSYQVRESLADLEDFADPEEYS